MEEKNIWKGYFFYTYLATSFCPSVIMELSKNLGEALITAKEYIKKDTRINKIEIIECGTRETVAIVTNTVPNIFVADTF